jgi:hypothetical protein
MASVSWAWRHTGSQCSLSTLRLKSLERSQGWGWNACPSVSCRTPACSRLAGPPTSRRDFFRAEMLFASIMPAHAETNGGRRVLFPLKRANFAVFGFGLCDRAARQDSMATPGNFGGGSTGPDQGFLGITRAPPSAPGRGRAQSPVRRNPDPQTTEHESGSHSRSFSNMRDAMVPPSNSNASRRPAPHLVPAGCIAPADGVGKATRVLELSQMGYNQVSPKNCMYA